jgi:hypothetical protein
MPKIELTDEQAEELKQLIEEEFGRINEQWEDRYPSDDPDLIEAQHRESVLRDILHLLEIA